MEVEKLSISKLISKCKVNQLWALVVVIAGLIAGAFGLGYKIHSIVTEAKTNSIQLEIAKLKGTLESRDENLTKMRSENDHLHDKDRFLSLYLRYQIAKEIWNHDYEKNEEFQEYMTAKKVFNEYVTERVGRDKLILNKGGGRLATVKFNDGTIWTLPRELHSVVKK